MVEDLPQRAMGIGAMILLVLLLLRREVVKVRRAAVVIQGLSVMRMMMRR